MGNTLQRDTTDSSDEESSAEEEEESTCESPSFNPVNESKQGKKTRSLELEPSDDPWASSDGSRDGSRESYWREFRSKMDGEDFYALMRFFDGSPGCPDVTVEKGRIVEVSFSNSLDGHRDAVYLKDDMLPSSIGSCIKLRKLSLNRLDLQGILPSSLQYCKNLTCLELSNNAIAEIPQWLGELVKLRTLKIVDNDPMTCDVPRELDNLTELQCLDLNQCRIQGYFRPMQLFERLCRPGHKLSLAGNKFKAVDFKDKQFTEGVLRDYDEETSMCVASFCGVEFLEWQKLLLRTDQCPQWSQLCVFLKTYAGATHKGACPPDWHAGGYEGSPKCAELGKYFNMMGERAIEAHRRYGCQWFRKWTANVSKAVDKGHTRFVVFTKDDFTLGDSQGVECCYLDELRKNHDIRVDRCSIMDLDEALQAGVSRYGTTHYPYWNDNYDHREIPFYFKENPDEESYNENDDDDDGDDDDDETGEDEGDLTNENNDYDEAYEDEGDRTYDDDDSYYEEGTHGEEEKNERTLPFCLCDMMRRRRSSS
eukprot:TRINITY_DN873_c0_g2_i1.p1 TRINITY_DN873_c0_g2~~TRINITY_DN873_c0_g2_i1.p1  ORF type:complete len:546 (+),score=75.29 TRINITY_DN873_c0_g2_i1:30-1640(+)